MAIHLPIVDKGEGIRICPEGCRTVQKDRLHNLRCCGQDRHEYNGIVDIRAYGSSLEPNTCLYNVAAVVYPNADNSLRI